MAAIEEVNLEKILPSNGPSIKEVKKYLEKYSEERIVIKCGGSVLIDPNLFNLFISDIAIMIKLGLTPTIVHGGSPIGYMRNYAQWSTASNARNENLMIRSTPNTHAHKELCYFTTPDSTDAARCGVVLLLVLLFGGQHQCGASRGASIFAAPDNIKFCPVLSGAAFGAAKL